MTDEINHFSLAEDLMGTFRGPAEKFRNPEPPDVFGWAKELVMPNDIDNHLVGSIANLAVLLAVSRDTSGKLQDCDFGASYEQEDKILRTGGTSPLPQFPKFPVQQALTELRDYLVGKKGWAYDPVKKVYRSRFPNLFAGFESLDAQAGNQNALESVACGLFTAMGVVNAISATQDQSGKLTIEVPEVVYKHYSSRYSRSPSPLDN